MAYELRTIDIDASKIDPMDFYTGKVDTTVINDFCTKAINQSMKLFNLTPGDWIRSNYTTGGKDENGKNVVYKNIIRGRKATMDLISIKLNFQIYVWPPDYNYTSSSNVTPQISLYYVTYDNKLSEVMTLNASVPWTEEYQPTRIKAMIEYIKDIGNGVHYSLISGTGKRERSMAIVPYYHLETGVLQGWALSAKDYSYLSGTTTWTYDLGNPNEKTDYYFNALRSNTNLIPFPYEPDADDPTKYKLLVNTMNICGKSFTLGIGNTISSNDEVWLNMNLYGRGNKSFIQNKIKLPNAYKGQDLFLVVTNLNTVAYVNVEEDK